MSVAEVATIFQPRRSRAPSIILNEEQSTHGSFVSPGQIILDTSGYDPQGCSVGEIGGDSASSCRSLETGSCGGNRDCSVNQGHNQPQCQTGANFGVNYQTRQRSLFRCYSSCCAESAKKIYFGVCVTVCVTASWVGATHCIKYLYFYKPNVTNYEYIENSTSSSGLNHQIIIAPYNAPFFTTWFCTNWTVLYFPVYFICQIIKTKCSNPSEIITESLQGFRDKGFTSGRFLIRCSLFCGLWVGTNYMYIHSLRILFATDVMAVFATNVSCVYLLSWVILHEQFVGVRIVAVILCDTGIALLAYMDGITGSPTLAGVVLAASAAAGSAVYKVLFKKVIGETTFGQVSLFFSLIGLCNAALLWPICLALYFSGVESVHWAQLPWIVLLSASILHLIANMLGNFSIALTYDLFITLGLITAVPVSAALDVVLYGGQFMGMKLAGMILIAVGFFLVMFPDNWPDYITRLLRTRSHHDGLHRHGVVDRFGGNRSRRQSFQQRHFRRNYGVSSSHGDEQTLLPTPAINSIHRHIISSSSDNTNANDSTVVATTATTTTTATNNINNISNNNSNNNIQRLPNSSNHSQRSSQLVPNIQSGGVEDTETECQVECLT